MHSSRRTSSSPLNSYCRGSCGDALNVIQSSSQELRGFWLFCFWKEVTTVPEQQELPQQRRGISNDNRKGSIYMKSIDPKGLAGYNSGVEKGRLHRSLGLIEFERTKEILLEELPEPPAVIYDIGGAYGEYAYWLAALGYEVYLYDLAEEHIRMAKEMAHTKPAPLAEAAVADARSIPRPDASADAILLFGPLYHLVEEEERRKCLAECMRLLRHGGRLFTANITCFATALKFTELYDRRPELDDDARYRMIEVTVRTGLHRGNEIGLVYFHRPDELRREVAAAGFTDVELRGVIGPAWIIRNLDEIWPDPIKRESVMRIVRLLDREESLMGFSTHFLSVSRKMA